MSTHPRAFALTILILALGAGPAHAADRLVAKPTDLACGNAGAYPTINMALAAANPGDTVKVCPGLYQERVVINEDGIKLVSVKQWQAAIQFPPGMPGAGETNQLVHVTAAKNVLIQGFTIEGPWTDTGNTPHEGVRVDGGASAVIDHNHITEIEDANSAARGVQDGVAIRVGRSSTATAGRAEIKNNLIDKYQKNGPTVDGAGSFAKIHDNTIDGGGDHSIIARNGIQVGRNAGGVVEHNRVFNNYYTGTSFPPPSDTTDDNDATGVLVFEVTGGVSIHDNTLYLNDLGVEIGVGAANEEAGFGDTSGVLIDGNTTNSNVFDGLRANDDAIGNTFHGNKATSNGANQPSGGGHDCHDDSSGTGSGTPPTANTWNDNQGNLQTPEGICKRP